MPATEAGLAIRAKIREALQKARQLNNTVEALAKENKDAEASELLIKEAGPAITKWQDAIDENLALQDASNKKDAMEAEAAYSSALTAMLVLSGLAIAAGAAAAITITRGLLKQLGANPIMHPRSRPESPPAT